MRRSIFFFCVFLIAFTVRCATSRPQPEAEIVAVNAVIDEFHKAASQANETRYFELLSENAVFLGTDATERWNKTEFLAFAHPHFVSGKGWTFTPKKRNVSLSADGRSAWFDESLHSASYGECRGTGALQRVGEKWLIEQYNLTIPIPNDLAKEFVDRIKQMTNDVTSDE